MPSWSVRRSTANRRRTAQPGRLVIDSIDVPYSASPRTMTSGSERMISSPETVG